MFHGLAGSRAAVTLRNYGIADRPWSR